MPTPVTFRQLQVVGAVLETGSVSRAAERLYVSQPAISQIIRELEAGLGQILFRRINGRLVPTAEIELLREELNQVLRAVSRTGSRLQQIANLAAGKLKVMAFPSIATTVLPQLLARLCARHPELFISLDGVNNSHRMIDGVRESTADLAISNVPTRASGIECEHLARYPVVCVVQPAHRFAATSPVPLQEIVSEYYISLGADDESQLVISRAFESLGLQLPLRAEVNLCASACAWVATSGGCSLVDPFTAGEWNGQLARLETQPTIWQDLWLLRKADQAVTRWVSLFLDELQVCVGEFLASKNRPDTGTRRA